MDASLLPQRDRPGTLVAIIVLIGINGLFGILTATLLLLSGLGQGAIAAAGGLTLPLAIPLLIIALSLLALLSAVGLWMLRCWARLLAIAVALPFGLLAVFGIVASGGRDPGTYLTVVVALLTPAVLSQARIKGRFN